MMLKISRYFMGVVVLILAAYGLITKNFGMSRYMLLATAVYMLVFGLSEFKEARRENGLNLLFVCAFTLVVFVVILFF